MEEKISIQREKVLNAYKHASEEQKALLESMFGKDVFQPKNIMERVKTFEDACEVLGEEHSYVQEYRGIANVNFDFTQDIIAYLKLRIICAALNEGWQPTHDGYLTLKTEELENYCAEQFIDIWSDYLFG